MNKKSNLANVLIKDDTILFSNEGSSSNDMQPIIQKEIIILDSENCKTSEILTQFEYTEIISHRAKQIENGGICFTDVQYLTDPIMMAEKELKDGKCPLDIIRMLTDKIGERWHVNEMAIDYEYIKYNKLEI